jgi:hypothetical protein
MTRRTTALPIALIALGLWLLVGCIYIPTFNKHESGVDASKQVGGPKSGKPIRAQRSTRADVERLLGPPFLINDGSAIAYRWQVLKGVWVMPFCFMADADRGTRALVLRFDDVGMLRSFETGWLGEVARGLRPLNAPRPHVGPMLPPRNTPVAHQQSSPPSNNNSPPAPPPGPRYDTPPAQPSP